MRKIITAFLLEHSTHDERYLGTLSDAALLRMYDQTRDTINSIADI